MAINLENLFQTSSPERKGTFSNYSPGVKNGLAPWATWSYSCLFCFCVCGMAELLLEKPNLYIFSFVEIDHEIFSTIISPFR